MPGKEFVKTQTLYLLFFCFSLSSPNFLKFDQEISMFIWSRLNNGHIKILGPNPEISECCLI